MKCFLKEEVICADREFQIIRITDKVLAAVGKAAYLTESAMSSRNTQPRVLPSTRACPVWKGI